MRDFSSDVQAVFVTFGFSNCHATPNEISRALGLYPDGSTLSADPSGNSWWMLCSLISNDPNHHIQDLLSLLAGKEDQIRPEWNPQFKVEWQSERLLPEGGHVYDPDVVAGIARCKASLKVEIRKNNVFLERLMNAASSR